MKKDRANILANIKNASFVLNRVVETYGKVDDYETAKYLDIVSLLCEAMADELIGDGVRGDVQ